MNAVKGAEPRLFITTRTGQEALAAEEVLNLLYPYDRCVRARVYRKKGYVVILGCRSPDELVRRVRQLSAFSKKVLPIHIATAASYEAVIKAVLELVYTRLCGFPRRFRIECRKRGWYIDSCTSLTLYVGEALERLGLGFVERNADTVIVIEVVDDHAYLSLTTPPS
ncbi:MAG: hypothetical protein DRO39_09640 [Thermoprotei archaeon]|nr:MAG: hypothetical protein DRO39_09640 [Thermoprotei archaeon]